MARWLRLPGARARRRILVLLFAAGVGGFAVILLDRAFFRRKPAPLPVVISTQSGPPPARTLAPMEAAHRSNVNPCFDLHTYVCSLGRSEDPTGEVRRDSEGEVEVLRIYENIIRTHRKLSSAEIDRILVRKVYTPERTSRVRELFEKTRGVFLAFIESQPFQALSEADKAVLRARIERVTLELPPPASVYADEPDLFTRNDVFFERTAEGKVRIRMGGAILFTAKSKFNLAFTLAHELAHSIDPCELRNDKVDILSYRGLAECFGAPSDTLETECSSHGKLSEVFADWAATNVVSEILSSDSPRYTSAQMRLAVYNSVRDLCREDDSDPATPQTKLSSDHPNVAYRVNWIFAQHPRIRQILGCKENLGPSLPGVPQFCYWKPQTPAQSR